MHEDAVSAHLLTDKDILANTSTMPGELKLTASFQMLSSGAACTGMSISPCGITRTSPPSSETRFEITSTCNRHVDNHILLENLNIFLCSNSYRGKQGHGDNCRSTHDRILSTSPHHGN
jgi:hypothetical protein